MKGRRVLVLAGVAVLGASAVLAQQGGDKTADELRAIYEAGRRQQRRQEERANPPATAG